MICLFAGRQRGVHELDYSAELDFRELSKTPIRPRLVSGDGLEVGLEPGDAAVCVAAGPGTYELGATLGSAGAGVAAVAGLGRALTSCRALARALKTLFLPEGRVVGGLDVCATSKSVRRASSTVCAHDLGCG